MVGAGADDLVGVGVRLLEVWHLEVWHLEVWHLEVWHLEVWALISRGTADQNG